MLCQISKSRGREGERERKRERRRKRGGEREATFQVYQRRFSSNG
jgi:hypothetical protein